MQNSTLFKFLVVGFSIFGLFGGAEQQMNKPIATWIWHTAEAFEQQEDYLQFAKTQQVGKIHLQIDPSIEPQHYIDFVEQANAQQIEVYALGGSPSWTTDRTDFDSFLAWVTNFQQTTGLFAGIHADIEPYLLDNWHSDDQQALIAQFFERIETLSLIATEQNFQLEIDIPFWFDEIHYNNQFGRGIVSEWLIDHTDHITIMAYRNKVQGKNGVNQLVKQEMHYAKKQQKTVTIAVETVPSDEGDDVSFYGHTERHLQVEIRKITRYWKNNEALSAIGIHSMHSWMTLVNKEETSQ